VPTFADLLSSLLNPPDPNDLLRDPMNQGQTLTGMGGNIGSDWNAPFRVPPSPSVPGPLAALATRTALRPGKPHIRLKVR